MKLEYTFWEKLSALLVTLATFYAPLAKILLYVALLLMVVAGSFWLIGYSWSWIALHFVLMLIILTPTIFVIGLIWISIRDDYRRVLQGRYRKW